MAHLDAYVRVSQVRGRSGDSFISPDLQAERIAAWATAHGHTISLEHRELDVSGGSVDRPMLNEAMRRIEAGETGGVVVFKLDRFGRTLVDSLALIDRIRAVGGTFASVSDGFDLSTETGRLVLRIMLSLAEFELERIRANWRDARERAVERGVHVASRTPTGYQRERDGRLAPHPQHAAAIREVFEMRAAGASWADLARHLDGRGVVGPYAAIRWTPRAVAHIIDNRVYLGEARSGEFVNENAHPPLVDRATWTAAQAANPVPPARSNEPALLAGLVRCASCRHLLRPDKQTMRDGTRARIYRCRRDHASGRCPGGAAILGSVIEPYVTERFLSRMAAVAAERVDTTGELEQAAAALRDAEDDLTAYRDSPRILATLGEDRFLDGLQTRLAAVDAATEALAKVRAAATPAGLPAGVNLGELWPDLDTRERQQLLRAGADAVMVRSVGRANAPVSDRTLVLWHGDAPDDLPGRGRRNVPLAPFEW